MLIVNVNGTDYKVIEHWNELTIEKAVAIHTRMNSAPDSIKELYKIISNRDEHTREKLMTEWSEQRTDHDLVKLYPMFYGSMFEFLTNIPMEVVNQIKSAERTVFYKQFMEKFVIGIWIAPIDYHEQRIVSFPFKGVEYFLPITTEILGTERPMHDRTAIEFTESADLELFSKELAGGKFERAANIIAILCRPKPFGVLEPYNEDTCLKRAEEFKQLTMDIAFEVFFCLHEHIIISRQTSTISQLNHLLAEQTKLMLPIQE